MTFDGRLRRALNYSLLKIQISCSLTIGGRSFPTRSDAVKTVTTFPTLLFRSPDNDPSQYSFTSSLQVLSYHLHGLFRSGSLLQSNFATVRPLPRTSRCLGAATQTCSLFSTQAPKILFQIPLVHHLIQVGMLILPNELILIIAKLLYYRDLQCLRCVNRRLRGVLSVLRLKPTIVRDEESSFEPVRHALANRVKELQSTRALLVHAMVDAVSYNWTTNSWELGGCDQTLRRLFEAAVDVEYLSISVPGTGHTHLPISLGRPTSPSYLSRVTHLEIIGVSISPLFLAALPDLVDVTVTASLAFDTATVGALVDALVGRNIRSLKVACWEVPINFLENIARKLPNLITLFLASPSDTEFPFSSVFVRNCHDSLELYAKTLSRFRYLENVYLPLFVGQSSPTLPRSSRMITNGKVLGMGQGGCIVDHEVYLSDLDTIKACGEIARLSPKLSFIGWLAPWMKTVLGVSRPMFVPLACKRNAKGKWRYSLKDDLWPESDMDSVFPA